MSRRRTLAVAPTEALYVYLVEDAERAAFEPPARVLVTVGSEAKAEACRRLGKRLAEWTAPPGVKKGFLSIYQQLVQQADKGAVLAAGKT